jgi:beta-N-acetylhexosaminidase
VARDAANSAAKALRPLGINVNLAPVVDVATPGSFLASRAFPGDAVEVAAITRGAIRGYKGTRLAPTVKHFPGLGGSATNTDEAPATIERSRTEMRTDLEPFEAAIAAGTPLVMSGHGLYPALDPNRIASQSKAILTDLLRDDLQFRGVVITDSLEADAVLARSSVQEAASRSLRAGADLLLMTGPGSYPLVYRRLQADAKRSPAVKDRIYEAAGRVLKLKRELGLPRPE